MKTLAKIVVGIAAMAALAIMLGLLTHEFIPRPYSIYISAFGGGVIGGFGGAMLFDWVQT